jgi:glycosyltransferase involved in cell wall biosynthesis
MTRSQPMVTVLLPFVNVDAFLTEAIESILCQNYSALELLLLDNQRKKISKVPNLLDSRAKVINCRSFKTLSAVLNEGIRLANGKYVEFLEIHKDLDMVGTAIRTMSESGSLGELRLQPVTHEDIVRKLPGNNPFFHPTVMLRKDSLKKVKGPYSPFFKRSQDYELWTRLLPEVRAGNIAEPLLYYRIHQNQFGKRIAHQSIFYYRLAQFKYSIRDRKSGKSGTNWRVSVVIFKNLSVAFMKFSLSLWKLWLSSFKGKWQ